jgi:hypothetical protein
MTSSLSQDGDKKNKYYISTNNNYTLIPLKEITATETELSLKRLRQAQTSPCNMQACL